MSAPALNIAVRANLDTFKKQMEETSSLAKTAARKAGQQFLEMNRELAAGAGSAAFSTAGIAALQLAGRIALVVGAAKLMGDVIGASRDQLKDMVELSNKAQNLGVSSSFLQQTRAEAKKLQVGVEELDGALTHAFNATKDKSPVDLGAWDTGKDRITDVERALRVYNETVAKASGQRLEGLVLFRDADTQEKKIQAVLKAMIQLEQIGQKAASLDLGERMFGSAFVDRIRQGRTSAESLLTTIQKASGDADGIFPDVLVRRAKEMDDQLKVAHQRLSTALKPSWDDLAGVLLTMKGYWADTIGLIAKAAELSNQIKIPGFTSDTDIDAKRDALATVNARLNGTSSWTDTYGLLASRESLVGHRDRIQAEIAALAKGDQYGPTLPSQSRGTGAAPTRKPSSTDTGSDTDKLQSAIDGTEKRIASLKAEAATIDLTSEARNRSKIVAQLETVAMQANAAAGKGSNLVSEEQRQKIEEVANAYGKVVKAIETAKLAYEIKRGSQTALLDPQDVEIAERLKNIYPDVATALNSVEAAAMRSNEAMRSIGNTMSSSLTTGLTDILDGTKSVSDGFASMGKSIVRALEEAMIKMMIVQPIMRGLTGMLGFSGGGLVGNAASSAVGNPTVIGGHYADGGFISGPGTATSDSIPAMLSDGEFVVNARATSQNRPLLDAINGGNLRGFSGGGLVSDLPTPSGTMSVGGSTTNISPIINVSVEGGSRGPEADAAMGAQLAAAISDSVKKVVAQEMRTQSRPGGVLRR